tara:strand:+ start:2201 stop:2827 length:627 start_codon:yes stop_codon:yes gene_type:complete
LIALASISWFCFSNIKTTFYLVREQANTRKRTRGEENVGNFISIMSNDTYKDTCLIVNDISNHSPEAFHYSSKKNIKRFPNPYIVVKDIKLFRNAEGCEKFKKIDIFEQGTIHGRCTLNNILHIAMFLRYKKIIFVGIDLYDSRYFWLNKKETRYSVREKRKNFGHRHVISRATINLVRQLKKTNKVEMFTYNPKSLLKKVMPVWERS